MLDRVPDSQPIAQWAQETLSKPKIKDAGMLKGMNEAIIQSMEGKDKLLQMLESMRDAVRVR